MKPSKFYYQLVTALIFLGLALYVWLVPSAMGTLSGGLRRVFIISLMLWAIFRGLNAYWIWKRSNRDNYENHS